MTATLAVLRGSQAEAVLQGSERQAEGEGEDGDLRDFPGTKRR